MFLIIYCKSFCMNGKVYKRRPSYLQKVHCSWTCALINLETNLSWNFNQNVITNIILRVQWKSPRPLKLTWKVIGTLAIRPSFPCYNCIGWVIIYVDPTNGYCIVCINGSIGYAQVLRTCTFSTPTTISPH